jgi:hypothetical protein
MPGCWRCDYETESASCERCGVWVVAFDASTVPEPVRSLLPLARRWGIPDDGYRSEEVDAASEAELAELTAAAAAAPEQLWDWLVSDSAAAAARSNEHVALTCLTMAFDQAQMRRERRP